MSAIAPPSFWLPELWTPRSGSWWRLPTWFTAGKQQRKSTGKMQRSSTGKMRRNTASNTTCCCGCTCCNSTCSNCGATATTPSRYQVTFSDVVTCPSNVCHVCTSSTSTKFTPLSDYNNTYCLATGTPFPGACLWGPNNEGGTGKSYNIYGNNTCTSGSGSGATGLTVELRKTNATTFTLSIGWRNQLISGITWNIYAFYGTFTTASNDCPEVLEFTSTNVTCGCSVVGTQGTVVVATGGTAIATRCAC